MANLSTDLKLNIRNWIIVGIDEIFMIIAFCFVSIMNTYFDLISQSFEFPQEKFSVKNGELYFNNLRMMDLVEQYETPMKLSNFASGWLCLVNAPSFVEISTSFSH